jgi:hypothetical protein
MSTNKKENLFTKLVAQQQKAIEPPAEPAIETPPEEVPPSPAPPEPARPKASAAKKLPELAKGKRVDPNYCQANAYVPKSLRKAVDRALLDIDGLDYSTLVTDLLRKWVKSRGVSE